MVETPSYKAATAIELIAKLRSEIAKAIIGQQEVIDQVLVALAAGGHALIEGVPGLGKTLLVRALAACVSGQFARIQFTSDLMPSDITGHALFDMKSEQFKIRKGPVFCHFLLADEINRAPAKTQAALLEVMQEGQVTIEGKGFILPPPFMVLATQNPIEQEGTYPLPEAQLDRFLLKINIDYPQPQDELDLVRAVTRNQVGDKLDVSALNRVAELDEIPQLQAVTAQLGIDEQILDYAVRLVAKTRTLDSLQIGAGPRGSIAMVRAARGYALLQGREYVTPDDIKSVAHPVLRHRLQLSADLEMEGRSIEGVIDDILDQVSAPRS